MYIRCYKMENLSHLQAGAAAGAEHCWRATCRWTGRQSCLGTLVHCSLATGKQAFCTTGSHTSLGTELGGKNIASVHIHLLNGFATLSAHSYLHSCRGVLLQSVGTCWHTSRGTVLHCSLDTGVHCSLGTEVHSWRGTLRQLGVRTFSHTSRGTFTQSCPSAWKSKYVLGLIAQTHCNLINIVKLCL